MTFLYSSKLWNWIWIILSFCKFWIYRMAINTKFTTCIYCHPTNLKLDNILNTCNRIEHLTRSKQAVHVIYMYIQYNTTTCMSISDVSMCIKLSLRRMKLSKITSPLPLDPPHWNMSSHDFIIFNIETKIFLYLKRKRRNY